MKKMRIKYNRSLCRCGVTPEPPFSFPNRYRVAYANLWDTLNAKRGFGWDENPWMWVYSFERVR
jgi:hypothetical protein